MVRELSDLKWVKYAYKHGPWKVCLATGHHVCVPRLKEIIAFDSLSH